MSANLSLKRLNTVNKIEKQTVVEIGQVISVGKLQMHYQLMPDCSMSQIGLKYVSTAFVVHLVLSILMEKSLASSEWIDFLGKGW